MRILLRSKKGVSIIGAIFTLIILGIFGSTIVSLVSTEQEMRGAQIAKDWAFYTTQAALEFAIKEIDKGGYPLVTNKSFAEGHFTIAVAYDEVSQREMTAVATVGEVVQTHKISYDAFEGDCLSVDYSHASASGSGNTNVVGITVEKICNNGVTIDKIFINWVPDHSEIVTLVSINNDVVWEGPIGKPAGSTVDIVDTLLSSSSDIPVDVIRFNGDMSAKTLTLQFILTDSSTETVSFSFSGGGSKKKKD